MNVTTGEASVLLYALASVPVPATIKASYATLRAQILLEDTAAKGTGSVDMEFEEGVLKDITSFFKEHEKLPVADAASVETLRTKILGA